jgi:serine protease inhibitor
VYKVACQSQSTSILDLPFLRPSQVFIDVNEEGTEAAAVTAVMMQRCAIPIRPPLELRFDRPFIFGVQHLPSAVFLFIGAVERPQIWQVACSSDLQKDSAQKL